MCKLMSIIFLGYIYSQLQNSKGDEASKMNMFDELDNYYRQREGTEGWVELESDNEKFLVVCKKIE